MVQRAAEVDRRAARMTLGRIGCWIVAASILTIGTLPIWGWGSAYYFDSQRTVLASSVSPDGSSIAQVERLVVGDVPNIILTLRSSWAPNWYLMSCAAVSHYGETQAGVRWLSNDRIALRTSVEPKYWRTDAAPFKHRGCGRMTVVIEKVANYPDRTVSLERTRAAP